MESNGDQWLKEHGWTCSQFVHQRFLSLLTNMAEKIKRSTSAFSLHRQFIIYKSSDEKKDNHQLEETILIQHQILRTDIDLNVWELERRIWHFELLGLNGKRLETTFKSISERSQLHLLSTHILHNICNCKTSWACDLFSWLPLLIWV